MTSVSIVDWNKGILSDLSSIISSGDEQEETFTNEDDDTGPGYTVVKDGLPGDTYPEEYSLGNQIQGNSFGFHIVKGYCLLWYNILFALVLLTLKEVFVIGNVGLFVCTTIEKVVARFSGNIHTSARNR